MPNYKITYRPTPDGIKRCNADVNIPLKDMRDCCVKEGKIKKLNSHNTVTVEVDSVNYEDVPVWIHTDVGSRQAYISGKVGSPEECFKNSALLFPYAGGVSLSATSGGGGTTYDPTVLLIFSRAEERPLGVIQVLQSVLKRFPEDGPSPFPTYRAYGLFRICVGLSASGLFGEQDYKWTLYDFTNDCIAEIPTISTAGGAPSLPFFEASGIPQSNFYKIYNYLYDGYKTNHINVYPPGTFTYHGDFFNNIHSYDSSGVYHDPGMTVTVTGQTTRYDSIYWTGYSEETILNNGLNRYIGPDGATEIKGNDNILVSPKADRSQDAYAMPYPTIPYSFMIVEGDISTRCWHYLERTPNKKTFSNGVTVEQGLSFDAKYYRSVTSSGNWYSNHVLLQPADYETDDVEIGYFKSITSYTMTYGLTTITASYEVIEMDYDYEFSGHNIIYSGSGYLTKFKNNKVHSQSVIHEIPIFGYSGDNLIMGVRIAGVVPLVQRIYFTHYYSGNGPYFSTKWSDAELVDLNFPGAAIFNPDSLIQSTRFFDNLARSIFFTDWTYTIPAWDFTPEQNPSMTPYKDTRDVLQAEIGLRVEGFYVIPHDIRETLLRG